MEQDAGVASERRASPDPAQLDLLQSACRSLSANQPAGDSDVMNRPPNGAAAAGSPDRPPAGAALQNESSDADIFFEYDVESGAAGSASGGVTGGADGGADTGCALTSPAGGSRDPSPVPPAPAAASPSAEDYAPVRSDAMPVPGGGRSGGDFSRSAGGAVPVPAARRGGGSLGHRPQQSPSEKVDAWLRACHEDSGTSAEEDEPADEAAAAVARAPDEPQFVLDEDRASAFEDSSETEEMVDAVAADEVHDLRELMARGLELLDLDPDLEPPAAAAPSAAAAHEAEQLHDEQWQGAVGGCAEDAGSRPEHDCPLDRQYPRFTEDAGSRPEHDCPLDRQYPRFTEDAGSRPEHDCPLDRQYPRFTEDAGSRPEHDCPLDRQYPRFTEDAGSRPEHDCPLDRQYPRFTRSELASDAEGARAEGAEDELTMDAEVRGAEGGEVRGAEGGVTDAADADADADDEAASTSGASSSFAPPDLLKRSTSLKSGKTPPQTPGRKKFVRFADAMGLDLQRVHTFRDEIPTVPAAAFRGLDTDVRAPSPPPPLAPDTFQMSFGSAALSDDGDASLRLLVPMFLQPGGSLGFLDRLRRDRVVLENVLCNNTDFTINATVRVLNMDFHKVVFVRYTLNDWQTNAEQQAEYVPGSCDGLSDRFRFTLHAGALSPGERIQFVLRFECQCAAFWDNNGGENYSVQMVRSASSTLDEPGDWSGGRL